ncbi:reverse transcriptase domain-containing protein [Tanacetum coccineum]
MANDPNNVQGPPPVGPNFQNPNLDLRLMKELLQAPTDGVGDAIVVPPILANQFELKISLLNLVTAIAFHANGNFLTKNTQEALTIIENKSKVQTSRNKPQVLCAIGSSTQDAAIIALTKQVEALVSSMNRIINSIQNGYETCGGPHAYYECQAAGGYTQEDVYATTGQNVNQKQAQPNVPSLEEMMLQHMRSTEAKMQQMQTHNTQQIQQLQTQNIQMANLMGQMQKDLQERPQGAFLSNTIPNPREELKAITTRSGIALAGPSVPPPPLSSSKEVEQDPKMTTDQPPKQNPHQPLILYPSRLNKEKLQDKSDIQVHKFFQMFKKLHLNIIIAEALALMPKYHKMLKDLLSDKEKLLGLANTSLTENCSAVLLKKLPEKLGDPGKFLIPCDFPELEKCMALANLGASINLMSLSVWKKLMLPELVPTRMTLELANRSIAYPADIAEDVFVQVGKFTFPADFVVVNYDVDPHVPLILGRPFLRTARALVDVYGEELILRDGDEKLIFHADSTLKHPQKHGNNGSTTSSSDSFPSLTSFETSDSLLEEFADWYRIFAKT